MKILALESSAVACSVALTEDDFLIAEAYQNNGLTHSVTLMPMCEDLLKNCGLTLQDMDVIAVAAGPGSFTGLRICVSAALGLGWALDQALRQGFHLGGHGLEPFCAEGRYLPGDGRSPQSGLQRPIYLRWGDCHPPDPGSGHQLGGSGERVKKREE